MKLVPLKELPRRVVRRAGGKLMNYWSAVKAIGEEAAASQWAAADADQEEKLFVKDTGKPDGKLHKARSAKR